MPRILIAECKQEVSTFNPHLSGYDDFCVRLGNDILTYHRAVRNEVGGKLQVEFLDQGSEITWTMNLTNMTAVTQSHIHLGDATAVAPNAGPVIINLFIPNGATATLNGEVAHGSITNANNANVSLDSLRVLFNNGHAYANVHTTAHPGGEIRDQIHPAP